MSFHPYTHLILIVKVLSLFSPPRKRSSPSLVRPIVTEDFLAKSSLPCRFPPSHRSGLHSILSLALSIHGPGKTGVSLLLIELLAPLFRTYRSISLYAPAYIQLKSFYSLFSLPYHGIGLQLNILTYWIPLLTSYSLLSPTLPIVLIIGVILQIETLTPALRQSHGRIAPRTSLGTCGTPSDSLPSAAPLPYAYFTIRAGMVVIKQNLLNHPGRSQAR